MNNTPKLNPPYQPTSRAGRTRLTHTRFVRAVRDTNTEVLFRSPDSDQDAEWPTTDIGAADELGLRVVDHVRRIKLGRSLYDNTSQRIVIPIAGCPNTGAASNRGVSATYKRVEDLLTVGSDPDGGEPGPDAVLQRTLASGRQVYIRHLPYRLVEQVVRHQLAARWNRVAPSNLYSNLKNVSRFDAFGTARTLFRWGYVFGAHTDISKCFDSTPVALVHKALVDEMPDLPKGLLRLLLWLQRSEVLRQSENGWIQDRCPGTLLTGTPLAPVLCDVVLAHVLDRRLASACNDRWACLRYVDDLLVLGRSADDVKFGMAAVRHLLDPVYALNASKTTPAPVDLRTHPLSWLGKIISTRRIDTPATAQLRMLDRIVESHPDDAETCETAIRDALREMIFDTTEVVEAFRDVLVTYDPRWGRHWADATKGWGRDRNKLIQVYESPNRSHRRNGGRRSARR